jgi:HAE1 family hydrophobic/amphiphilic exporter-1
MSFAKTVVSRPTTAFIIFVLLFLMGIFATLNLKIDLLPDIELPYMLVMTSYPGASPEEVERTITRPMEGVLSIVSNLDEMQSTSSMGQSIVFMSFLYGTDLADAGNSVRDNLEMVKQYLPEAADPPLIMKMDPSMMPIVILTVEDVKGQRSPEEIRDLAEDTILPRIEQVDGISTGTVFGGRERIIRIEIPQNRLEAYNLTVGQIQQSLAVQNSQIAAGNIDEGGISYILTTMGEYQTLDDIKNTVISYKGGGFLGGIMESARQIRLGDIADVTDSYRDEDALIFFNGTPSVIIQVQKQSGKNAVETADALKARILEIEEEIPQDINITEVYNTTVIIKNSISNVTSSAVTGAVLAVIILFVFLRSIKPTIIIGISIPVSILVTLMLMYFMGLTLNVMTLAGLALGVGMLVDNSIVILENIYRYREKGAKLTTAAVLGTTEMIVAIVASTLTTICVFAPLILFRGLLEMYGEIFSGLSFTVVISLSASLIVATVLIPVLASHYLPLVTRKQKPLRNAFLKSIDGAFERFFTNLDNSYRWAVDKVLRKKLMVILILLGLLAGSIALIFKIGFILMPAQEADILTLNIQLPLGSSLEETESVFHQFENIIAQETDGVEMVLSLVGASSGMGGLNSYKGELMMKILPFEERVDSTDDIEAKLRPYFDRFPDVTFSFSTGGMGGGGGGSPVDIIIRTEDLVKGKAIGERISELIRERVPEATDPTVDLQDGLPQIELDIDRERMYALGLNVYTIGQEIKAAVDGVTATQFTTEGKDIDVVLFLAEADRDSVPDLDQLFVMSPTGERVPMSNLASYKKGTGPININRENQGRVIHVTAGVVPGTPTNIVEMKVRELINTEIPAESDVFIEFSGEFEEAMKYGIRLVLVMVVAILLVFGVMASLFESLRDPFIILFTIPLSLIGIVALYAITGDTFNILTAVGLIVLVGVIVNNGIVLVDYTNLLRKRGYGLHEACVEAAGNRLRPILMTTLTTVLGLIPMAFFPGEGSEMVAPMGKAILGGLSFGTLMTLFLMPVIYYIFNRKDDQRRAKAEARRERIASGKRKSDVEITPEMTMAEVMMNEVQMNEVHTNTEEQDDTSRNNGE